MPDAIQYADVRRQLRDGRAFVLLGNGFSIGCDPVFRYESLFEAAVANGLSARAQAVFERLGTNNFEGVLRLLDDFLFIGPHYGLPGAAIQQVRDDIQTLKTSLVASIANSHLDHAALVSDEKKASALGFLDPFHSIFTTNYDLVLYWTILPARGRPKFSDGFHPPEDDQHAEYLVYSEQSGGRPGIYYLHGALHLYAVDGELRKQSWARTGRHLTDLIREGLTRNEYPLFVAEGTSDQKLSQISRHGYLAHCMSKFSRIESPLVIYGHSLGDSDRHLVEAICHNLSIDQVYIGLHGDPRSAHNERIGANAAAMSAERRRLVARVGRGSELDISFYQAESAAVWGGE